MKFFYKTAFITCLLFLVSGCKKDQEIPLVYVNFQVNLNLPTYFDLNYSGGSAFIDYIDGHTVGVRGAVLYRANLDQFMAYDAACPYDWEEDGIVSVDENLLTLTCNKCQSQFILLDGSPIKGKSKIGLKTYRTYYHADRNVLVVTN